MYKTFWILVTLLLMPITVIIGIFKALHEIVLIIGELIGGKRIIDAVTSVSEERVKRDLEKIDGVKSMWR